MSSFLNFEKKFFFITGVANKKSIAYNVAKELQKFKADLIITVQNQTILEKIRGDFPLAKFYLLDVTKHEDFVQLKKLLENDYPQRKIDGLLHSIAFARFDPQIKFHQTSKETFFEALDISSFSLMELSNLLAPHFDLNASVVTVGISDKKATSYGLMGPIKAMLEYSIPYLAKSFSATTRVRFNCVASGPLKTSASAGIPHYLENYLYAEKLTLRKEALKTQEVVNAILFLLSHASSGINASTITIDAGMRVNTFDETLVNL